MHTLSEILEVAEDARIEGRASLIDHEALVQASGTLRRIANRFATLDLVRLTFPFPPLDDATQASREATFNALRDRLTSWLAFYEGPQCLSRTSALALAARHSRGDIAQPLEQLIARLGADGFAMIAAWTLVQRRQLLAELESLRRLEFLMFELDGYLSYVPRAEPPPARVPLLHPSPSSTK
jgi:hypothetical protein